MTLTKQYQDVGGTHLHVTNSSRNKRTLWIRTNGRTIKAELKAFQTYAALFQSSVRLRQTPRSGDVIVEVLG